MTRRREALHHVVAGTCGGMASIVVCHPLDTVRTRLQTAEPGVYRNAWSCAVATVHREGIKGLYRGLWWPLCAQGIFKAIMFGVYGQSRQIVGDSLFGVALCGGVAGAVNSFVLTPIELIRNRQQVAAKTISGFTISRELIARSGVFPGLWTGLGATLCRDVPGVAAYYFSFELSRRNFANPKSLPSLALAGALGGFAFWTIALPFDHIKSRIQVYSPLPAEVGAKEDLRMHTQLNTRRIQSPFYISRPRSLHVLSLLRTTSIRQLYLGFGSALVRGIPGSAIVFVVYARVFEFLSASR